ncbi:dihydrofolate reductase family protein [Candidatus Enterococcus ferrettii]|uniref:Bacterial bifunctional deaminase-reductase C-terminal domain-containing protein n=1 Tax=Candidatus Enterococcus ferrettii TaxID=2815324 RepID=A0ABV0EXS5_9ENTE|nr:dihydrofolate reductase family protein [Enterococcus sp. 665A]MBO1339325.1 dihydrofolate reductase [Enterococcus sp. 665A]
MGKLVFYGAISLDGYLAGKNEDLDWLLQTQVGDHTSYEEFIETIGTVVMGRITYEEALRLNDNQPLYPDQKIVVFSRKHQTVDGHLTIHEDPVNYVQQMKAQEKNDIWLVGGGTLLHPLLEADLIDEWFIQIAPVLLGEGKQLFEPHGLAARLEFIETRQFGELVELHYRKKA